FTMNCPAPKSLQVGRYLNHSYLRIVTDEKGHNFNEIFNETMFNELAGRIPKTTAQELVRHARPKITELITQAQQLAAQQQSAIINQAIKTMQSVLQPEQERLTALAKVNSNIRIEEITYIEQTQQSLTQYLQSAQLSLNAVRVAIITEP
ncbi:MAG: RNA polymerase-associated protein RapA, partial [Gammaproteobacteria bacterium]